MLDCLITTDEDDRGEPLSLRDPGEAPESTTLIGRRSASGEIGDQPSLRTILDESERATQFQAASLEALVRMKLIANRRKDQVHYLLDLIGVGLLDASWPARFPPPLGERLQELLDDPNG